MLAAYYGLGCDSEKLFLGLDIANDPSFKEHLNKHNVILLDIQGAYIGAKGAGRMDAFPKYISELINAELSELYPDAVREKEHSLMLSLPAIHAAYDAHFVILFDEWDVIYREETFNAKLKKDYTDFLVSLFKNANVSPCIDLVYMTGIFPIPKLDTQSGLNNFDAFTMLKPAMFAGHIGFTGDEADALCQKFQMPFQEMKCWYDGYQLGSMGSVYCPFSVVQALRQRVFQNYWEATGSDAELFRLLNEVDPQYRLAVRDLLLGEPVRVSVDRKGLDLANLGTLDSILTALVHLGYLDYQSGFVRIPNWEVTAAFISTLREAKNSPAYEILARSNELLDKTFRGDADRVAQLMALNHATYASAYSYDQEVDLAGVIILSYVELAAEVYTYHRELETGKGFADVVFLPRPGKSETLIPILIELRWDETADTVLNQIKEQRYTGLAHGYPSALLVEIHYEKNGDSEQDKMHACVIRRVDKP